MGISSCLFKYFESGLVLDAFRANHDHLLHTVALLAKHQIQQIRLVDTAGTCLPHQLEQTVGQLVQNYPSIHFYGHFHDDFGMATSNAIIGLSLGLQGVDVSVGGFANRAGHPPLAEVVMSLKILYGITFNKFQYKKLFHLSRLNEMLYGLMENTAQAITGIITHSIQSGIRTELLKQAPTIFDVIDPREVGASLTSMFGIRSGQDGLSRFLKETRLLESYHLKETEQLVHSLYALVEDAWKNRSALLHNELVSSIQIYQEIISRSFFTEIELFNLLNTFLKNQHANSPH